MVMGPNLGCKLGHCGLLMAIPHNSQGFVLDCRKFVQMWRGHLCEPDGSSIVEAGARTVYCSKCTESHCISEKQWQVASSLPVSPGWFALAQPSRCCK